MNEKNFFKKIRNKYKAIRKKRWAAILIDMFTNLLLFAIAGGIGAFIAFAKYAGSVENYAQDYFEFYANQNWQSMYEFLDITESEYVNYDTFVRQAEVNTISVKDMEVILRKKTRSRAYLDIAYTDSNDVKQSIEVVLVKQKKKKYKFFSTWKVDPASLIAENYAISVPEGTEVTFDGVSLNDRPKSTADGKDTYTIDRLFKGEHSIGINTVYIDAYSQSAMVESDGERFDINIGDFEMKSEDLEYVKDAAGKVTFGMYTNALGKKGIDDLKQYFLEDESVMTSLSGCYDDLVGEVFKSNGAVLKSMTVTEYQIYDFEYSYPGGVEVRVDFKCTYDARTGRTMYNGVRGNYSGEAESQVKVFYVLDGTEWKIKELELTCFDYSPKKN